MVKGRQGFIKDVNMLPSDDHIFGPFRVEPDGHLLFHNEREVSLEPQAVRVLRTLIGNRDKWHSGKWVLKKAWGKTSVDLRNVAVQISNIKKALKNAHAGFGECIQSLPKRGYKFDNSILKQLLEKEAQQGVAGATTPESDYDIAFAELVARFKDSKISAYRRFAWRTVLSLQDAPDYQGWPMSSVTLRHRASDPFRLDESKQKEYKRYFKANHKRKRFDEDNTKFMLAENPTTFSDAPSLLLTVKACKWSEMQFYRDDITKTAERELLLEELIEGSLVARFPHSLCMHMVVITADEKLLITQRAPKVAYYRGFWSCSIEENLAASDLRARQNTRVVTWGMRALHEELGLNERAVAHEKMQVLSVFLESDDGLNISVCAEATLNITSGQLNTILEGQRLMDLEFSRCEYLPMERGPLLKEITHPGRRYHPTSGYRMVQTFLKHFGIPSREEIAKIYQH